MMLASPILLNPSLPTVPPRQHPLLTTPGVYDIAPWMYTALSRIHELEGEPRQLAGIGDLAITQPTAMYARTILDGLHRGLSPDRLHIPTPGVSPVSGGAIGFVWSLGSRHLEVIVSPDRVTSYVVAEGDSVLDEDDFDGEDTGKLQKALTRLLSA